MQGKRAKQKSPGYKILHFRCLAFSIELNNLKRSKEFQRGELILLQTFRENQQEILSTEGSPSSCHSLGTTPPKQWYFKKSFFFLFTNSLLKANPCRTKFNKFPLQDMFKTHNCQNHSKKEKDDIFKAEHSWHIWEL